MMFVFLPECRVDKSLKARANGTVIQTVSDFIRLINRGILQKIGTISPDSQPWSICAPAE